MALNTFIRDGFNTDTFFGERIKTFYEDAVASGIYTGINVSNQSQIILDSASTEQYTQQIQIQMTDLTVVQGSSLFEFIESLIVAVNAGKTCDYTLSEFIYAIPNLHGYIAVEFNDGL